MHLPGAKHRRNFFCFVLDHPGSKSPIILGLFLFLEGVEAVLKGKHQTDKDIANNLLEIHQMVHFLSLRHSTVEDKPCQVLYLHPSCEGNCQLASIILKLGVAIVVHQHTWAFSKASDDRFKLFWPVCLEGLTLRLKKSLRSNIHAQNMPSLPSPAVNHTQRHWTQLQEGHQK